MTPTRVIAAWAVGVGIGVTIVVSCLVVGILR